MVTQSPAAIGLKRLRNQAGLSVRAVAAGIGCPPSTYASYEDKFKKPRLPLELVERLVPVLAPHGVAAAALYELAGVAIDQLPATDSPQPASPKPASPQSASPQPAPERPAEVGPEVLLVPPPAGLPRDIEVQGVALGGDEGDFSFNGTVIDHVRRPPGLAGARGAFAIYVVGDSMSPRFDDGDLIFVHAGRPASPGDDVVVELHGEDGTAGACYVKRLLRRSGSRVVLRQFNPPRDDIVIPARHVKAIYRILTPAELLGV